MGGVPAGGSGNPSTGATASVDATLGGAPTGGSGTGAAASVGTTLGGAPAGGTGGSGTGTTAAVDANVGVGSGTAATTADVDLSVGATAPGVGGISGGTGNPLDGRNSRGCRRRLWVSRRSPCDRRHRVDGILSDGKWERQFWRDWRFSRPVCRCFEHWWTGESGASKLPGVRKLARSPGILVSHGGPKQDPFGLDADHDGIACEILLRGSQPRSEQGRKPHPRDRAPCIAASSWKSFRGQPAPLTPWQAGMAGAARSSVRSGRDLRLEEAGCHGRVFRYLAKTSMEVTAQDSNAHLLADPASAAAGQSQAAGGGSDPPRWPGKSKPNV